MPEIAGSSVRANSWTGRVRQRMWRVAPHDLARVLLRHNRIYILPTPRGIALIVTLAIMLVTSMNYALSLGYALAFLAGGMVASALLETFRNLTGVAVSPLGAGEAFAGGELEFTLSLASGTRQRMGITVAGRQGWTASVDLAVARRARSPFWSPRPSADGRHWGGSGFPPTSPWGSGADGPTYTFR
jgi:hypothetical protein